MLNYMQLYVTVKKYLKKLGKMLNFYQKLFLRNKHISEIVIVHSPLRRKD